MTDEESIMEELEKVKSEISKLENCKKTLENALAIEVIKRQHCQH